MIDLFKFNANPFDDIRISLNKLIDYSATHLQRLVTNNPGALFNARITGTTVALAAMDLSMSDNDTKLALRMARVQAKDAFRAALPENLARIHGAVVAAFGPDSTQLTECFPQGRSPFLVCPDDQLDDKLQALLTCLTPFSVQVGAVHVNNLGGLLSTWIALLADVETAAAGKNSSEAARRGARTALQLELFKNLLSVALAFPNDEAKILLYCPQHLLESEPVAGVPGETLLSISAFDPGTHQATFHLVALGAVTFTLERRLHGAAVFTELAADIVAVAGAATYQDTPAVPGQYEYRALATNGVGPGEPSPLLILDVAAAA